MVNTELCKEDRYGSRKWDDTDKCRAEVNSCLKGLQSENMLTKDQVTALKMITPRAPTARPTLKAHKDPLKIRLIINTRGSATYKIAKEVAKQIKPLTEEVRSFIKDSGSFVETVKDLEISDEEHIISFDVEEMYTSLPKGDVLRVLKEQIQRQDFRPDIEKPALIRLAEMSVQHMHFRYGNNFFVQKDGLFIGSPASPAFAEIYLQALERNHVYKMVNSPRLWLRKVDDTFVITKHDPQQMLKELNSIHPQVKFTLEQEKEGKLAFLDCLIEREEKHLNIKI